MYVRRKKNNSGLVSVQVIDKSDGKYKVAKTIGNAKEEFDILKLEAEGRRWIKQQSALSELDFDQVDILFEQFIEGITQVRVCGIEFVLGKLFDSIGFNKIKDELFRKLVLARLCYPVSKLKTIDYLRRYEGYQTDEDKIYRYLDKLHSTQKRTVQQISYNHTLSILDNDIKVVFYDVTTIYFEITAGR